MKASLSTRSSFLMLLVLAATLLAGCQSSRPVDWNRRVGVYTFDEAVMDYGPPDKQKALSDGKLVAQWIKPRHEDTSFSMGTGFSSGPVGTGAGGTTGAGHADEVLTLAFDTNYVLIAWSRNP